MGLFKNYQNPPILISMATLNSLCFLILLLHPHWLCIYGAWAAEEFQNNPELARQKAEHTSQSASSNGKKPTTVGTKLAETIPTMNHPTTNPSNFPAYTPTPTIVTVPSSNPTILTPFNPANPNPTPVTTDPSSTNPNPIPITNPTPTPGEVPITTPSTQVTGNAPIIPGQTWCIARAGVPETYLQQGLDYACGTGGVDCSMIQPGASCYFPNSIENHASYAFNSYFQRNPVPFSCDFGGTAVLVYTDPSTGSCIYPSSATVPTAMPSSTFSPATTASSSGATGSIYPPYGFNTYNPTSTSPAIFGPDSPPTGNSVPAGAAPLQPFMGFIILAASFSTGKLIGIRC